MNIEETRAQFEAWAKRRNFWVNTHPQNTGWYLVEETRRMWDVWQAALAARQPVGQEPVAITQFRDPECSDWYDVIDENKHVLTDPDFEKRTLYVAPPAQAVDLGQFRKAVEDGIAWNGCLYSTGQIDERRMVEVRDSYRALLALIYSQAVGNG